MSNKWDSKEEWSDFVPRVKELRTNYMRTDARKLFKVKMAEHDVTQRMLAEVIGLSPPAFSIRFKTFDFDFEQLAKMFERLKLSDEEIVKVMKI